ncbi:MAG: hypothetical protein H0V80_15335 [Acidobacteria bacterium]|nr:hypothetical protein [Acidobacteriota bacterium]
MSDRKSPLPPIVDDERRAHRRIPAAMLPHLNARVSGGPPVRLLDLSKWGVQLETAMFMRPGSTVCIRFVTSSETITLTGAVVRSTVAVLEAGGVTYHTALAFNEALELCNEVLHSLPDSEMDFDHSNPDDYTLLVTDRRTGLRAQALSSSY